MLPLSAGRPDPIERYETREAAISGGRRLRRKFCARVIVTETYVSRHQSNTPVKVVARLPKPRRC